MIYCKFLGHLIVVSKLSLAGTSSSLMSSSSRVPVKWFKSPGVARILSHDGLLVG